jgi:hypothetical protein
MESFSMLPWEKEPSGMVCAVALNPERNQFDCNFVIGKNI